MADSCEVELLFLARPVLSDLEEYCCCDEPLLDGRAPESEADEALPPPRRHALDDRSGIWSRRPLPSAVSLRLPSSPIERKQSVGACPH